MIPILYESTETAFTTNGIGRLSDCLSCIVTEERNGVYEVEFEYPVTGVHYEDILEGRIIAVTHDATGDIQPFDIYAREAPIDGVVTFHARHISYRLIGAVCTPFTASTCLAAINSISTHTVGTNAFSYWTDKSVTKDYALTVPKSVRAVLGGEEGSILDVFGTGEYEFDKFSVKLHVSRGSDKGVEIRYGKNLTDLTRELDYSEVHNGIVPYWKGTTAGADSETVVVLDDWTVYSGATPYDGRDSVFAVDMTEYFESKPTKAQLQTAAESFLATTTPHIPTDNITIDFVQLYQTEEYKDVAPLQEVCLCDLVTVYFPTLGINNVQAEVVKVVYNVLLDRYNEVELGDAKSTFYSVITDSVSTEVSNLEAQINDIKYVTRTATQYCLSSSRSSFSQYGTWQFVLPDYVTGYYYWQRTVTYYSDGTVTYGVPHYDMASQVAIEADIAADNAASAASTASGIASNALSVANTKRRVFTSTPTVPYDLNDMWFDGTHNNTYLCTTAKTSSGSYSSSDWTLYATDVSDHFWYDSSGAHVAENSGDVSTGSSQTIASAGTVIMRNGKLVTSWTGSSSSDAALNFYDCSSATASASDLVASYARAGITHYINNKMAMALTPSGLSFYDPTDGETLEAVFGSSGVELYSGGTLAASFGSTSAQIGVDSKSHINISTEGVDLYASNGSTSLAHFGYASGTTSSIGTATRPYYELGYRYTTSTAYSSSTTYSKGDHVTYNGVEYVCHSDDTTGKNPATSGFWARAIGNYSFICGEEVCAPYVCSQAFGFGTQTGDHYSLVCGMHNKRTTARFIVGNGGYRNGTLTRSNAFEVYSDGTVYAQGNLWAGRGSTYQLEIGTGAGGENHGIWSTADQQWLIYFDASGYVRSTNVYSKTVSTAANVNVASGGYLRRYTSSSKRYKKDITDLTDADLSAENLYSARVVQFKYRDDYLDDTDQRFNRDIPGFIVEELEEVYPIAVDYDDEQPEDWNVRYIVPPMLKLIQEQHTEIEELKSRVSALERN